MLVVPTGLEPAISCLKDRRLSQFAYDTINAETRTRTQNNSFGDCGVAITP